MPFETGGPGRLPDDPVDEGVEALERPSDELPMVAGGVPSEPTDAGSGPRPEGDPTEVSPESSLAELELAVDSAGAAPESRRRDSLLEVSIVVLVALFLALLLKIYVAEAYMIRGQSMQPTFVDGERVMVQKLGYEVERGDIIIFASKLEPGKDLIKRVIGLPGDRVYVKANGEVVINGEVLSEDYIRRAEPPRFDFGPYVVEPDTYFVLGDNRPQSQDSRNFQSVRAESLKGKVVLRWWPLQDLKAF